jgi:hypothetical protein
MVDVVYFELHHIYHLHQRQEAPCWSLTVLGAGHSYDRIIQELVRRHHREVNQAMLAPDRLECIEALLVQLLQKADDDGAASSPPIYKKARSRKKRRRCTGESEAGK